MVALVGVEEEVEEGGGAVAAAGLGPHAVQVWERALSQCPIGWPSWEALLAGGERRRL